MCDPVSMTVLGGIAGNIAGWGATATTLMGAAGGLAAGAAGKKGLEAMQPKAPATPPAAPRTQQAQVGPSAGALLTGQTGGGGFGPGQLGGTMLTGSKGATPSDALLGTNVLLGR